MMMIIYYFITYIPSHSWPQAILPLVCMYLIVEEHTFSPPTHLCHHHKPLHTYMQSGGPSILWSWLPSVLSCSLHCLYRMPPKAGTSESIIILKYFPALFCCLIVKLHSWRGLVFVYVHGALFYLQKVSFAPLTEYCNMKPASKGSLICYKRLFISSLKGY